MILSRGRRYLFIHIPKTGGTSMALALEGRAKKDDIMLGDTPKARKRRRRVKGLETSGRLWKHSKLRDLYGLLEHGELDGLFIFTLVRNPWDRMVSYYHWLRTQAFDDPAVGLAKTLEFEAFLHAPHIARSLHANPSQAYMRDQTGADRCTLYARLEHLQDDLAPLRAHLGFDPGPIGHENRSERARDYRPYYSDRGAAQVEALCKSDVSRFGYRFESG